MQVARSFGRLGETALLVGSVVRLGDDVAVGREVCLHTVLDAVVEVLRHGRRVEVAVEVGGGIHHLQRPVRPQPVQDGGWGEGSPASGIARSHDAIGAGAELEQAESDQGPNQN